MLSGGVPCSFPQHHLAAPWPMLCSTLQGVWVQAEAGALPGVLGDWGDKPACGAAEHRWARWCSTSRGVGARLVLPSSMLKQREGMLHRCVSG